MKKGLFIILGAASALLLSYVGSGCISKLPIFYKGNDVLCYRQMNLPAVIEKNSGKEIAITKFSIIDPLRKVVIYPQGMEPHILWADGNEELKIFTYDKFAEWEDLHNK
ncbi:hypothetical protein FE392_18360 [Xenorhabdus sp. 12]|uniref:Lipoprotein n=1 Tax=Xenorhabdus santafensis TaxID=2582833 RepID=A0ABU4SEN2_9GAMM|nr:hypothetical protein [Xenorhabdus sp. 12]MDX7989247.1 hypothetical protein [Xenorhabdus sp. 12]